MNEFPMNYLENVKIGLAGKIEKILCMSSKTKQILDLLGKLLKIVEFYPTPP